MQHRINISFGILLLGIVVFLIYNQMNQPKTGFVNTIELYNNFLLKQELEENMITTQKAREGILDSLKLDLQSLANRLESEAERAPGNIRRFSQLREQYLLKQQQFDEDNLAHGEKYTDQIWKQLNQYIKDYGTSYGYEYIFGADGQGKLMHAKESKDITDEIQIYINKRYQGGAIQ